MSDHGREVSAWRFAAVSAAMLITFVSMFGCKSKKTPTPPATPSDLRLGFTLFPYDASEKAQAETRNFVLSHGNTVLFHGDDGVPWAEALNDVTFPGSVEDHWRTERESIPAGYTIVVAVTPTDSARQNLAPNLIGPNSTEPLAKPFVDMSFDDPSVKKAFLNFCLRKIDIYRPDYLIVGIEVTPLGRSDQKWREFADLVRHVRSELKKIHPNLPIGIEHIVQHLMEPEIATRVKPLLQDLDFLGLSLYTYGDRIGELEGYDPFPPPPEEWKAPLQRVRDYVGAGYPLALHETGYTTRDVEIDVSTDPSNPYLVKLSGSEALQTQFIEDILQWARREEALYLVNFVAIDYPKLLATIPEWPEAGKLWVYTGLADDQLEPKPALKLCDAALGR